jgi:uncharacterized Zn finger protein
MYKLNFAQSEVLSKMMDKYPDVLMDRGEGLFWEDKIELIDQSVDEHQFFFNAFGSKKETYEVDVDLTPINDGRKKIQLDLQTFCSCPYFSDHGQCKHVAAALCILDSLEILQNKK